MQHGVYFENYVSNCLKHSCFHIGSSKKLCDSKAMLKVREQFLKKHVSVGAHFRWEIDLAIRLKGFAFVEWDKL